MTIASCTAFSVLFSHWMHFNIFVCLEVIWMERRSLWARFLSALCFVCAFLGYVIAIFNGIACISFMYHSNYSKANHVKNCGWLDHGRLLHKTVNTNHSGDSWKSYLTAKTLKVLWFNHWKYKKGQKFVNIVKKKWRSQTLWIFVRFSSIKNLCDLMKDLRNFCFYYFALNFLLFWT